MTPTRTSFEIQSWDEQPYVEHDDGRKLTRAAVTRAFSGDLQGQGSVEYLMAYAGDAYATFVGHERIEGTLGDRTGTFVLQHVGTFEDGVARAEVSVVAGTGTGELEGLTGDGTFVAERGPTGTVSLELGGTR